MWQTGALGIGLVLVSLGCAGHKDVALVGWIDGEGQLRTALMSRSGARLSDHLIVPTAGGVQHVQRAVVTRKRQCGEATATENRSTIVRADAAERLAAALEQERAALLARIGEPICSGGPYSRSGWEEETLTWATAEVMAIEAVDGGGEDEGGMSETTRSRTVPWDPERPWAVPEALRRVGDAEAWAEAEIGEMTAPQPEVVWIPVHREGQTRYGAVLWLDEGIDSRACEWIAPGPDGLAEPSATCEVPEEARDWSCGPSGGLLTLGAGGLTLRGAPAATVANAERMVMVRWASGPEEEEAWRLLFP